MYRTNSNSNSAGVGLNVHTPAKAMRQLFLFVLLTLLSINPKGYAAEDYIDYKYYEGSWTVLPDFNTLTPLAEGSQDTFALTGASANYFGFVYTAKLFIAEAGTYTFHISSDDGSRLLIDGAMVVEFDGVHGPSFRSGSISLDVGYHDIEVQYFEHTGGAALTVEWEGPNQARTPLQSFLNPDYDDDGIDNAVEGLDDSDGDGTADYLDTDSDGDGINDSVENANASTFNPTLEYESTNGAISRNPANVINQWLSNASGLLPTEGTEYAHFNASNQSNLYYDLGTLSPGSYEITLDVGDINNQPFPPNVTSGVYTGGTSATDLGTLIDGQRISNVQPAPGTWNVWSYKFEIPAGDPMVGQTFGLNFDVGAGSSQNMATDNIALSFVGLVDSDGDSIPDYLDNDSDGDGLSDASEGAGDTDGDGVSDYQDEDSDGDGVPDVTEGPDTYIVVNSSTVTGAEDTVIPLGINIDPAILIGGAQLDLIGAEVKFRDADDGVLPVTFTIPQQATYLRITGLGGSDNSSTSGTDEDLVFTSMLVDIRKATYSGHTALISTQRSANVNYAFTDVALGSSTLSGAVVGHSESLANSLTVHLSGDTLSINEIQSLADQAFHVEYLASSNSSSHYLGASAMVLPTGAISDSITMPIDTDFATLSIMMAKTTSTNAADEDKGVGYVSLDLETQKASGVIYVHDGAGGANVSSYAFRDYDLTAGVPLLSSTAHLVGDTTADSDALSDLTLSLVGNILTITRTTDMANQFSAMFSANSYERLAVGSSARSLGSSAASGSYDANSSITNEYDVAIPGNAKTAAVSMAMYNKDVVGNATGQLSNENSGVASFSVDLENETTSGAIMIMRSSTPDLVSWKNLPFGTRLMDHADTVSNHASVVDFSDHFAGVLIFSRVSLPDGSDVLRITATPETTGGAYHKYQVVLGAQWFGQLPIEFATSVANGSLSHGALDPDSGLWVVDPADVSSLAFVPTEHFSGADSQFTINYNGENDTVEIDVTRVADAPVVDTVDVQGTQRVVTDAADSYAAALVDVDGSESLFIELTITDGHTISDGLSSFTATSGDTKVDVSSWNPANLTYLADDVGVFSVGVRAVATDDDNFSTMNDTAETIGSFNVTLLLDTDADGEADIVDTDDDNDGISDIDESTADTDGDGTPDSLDTDSDGDGIPDATEGGGDADGDGVLDHIDNDTDGDGIPDSVEGNIDTDNDSIPDYLDIDSDNDGVNDSVEGTGDTDGDGIADYQDNFYDVIHNAVVWFRADDGVTDTGSGVSLWDDKSSTGTDVSRTPSAAVSLNEGMPEFNFNAAVAFDGSAGSMLSATAASGSPDDETFIAVARYTGNGFIEGVITYGSKGIFVGGSSASHQYVLDGSGAGSNSSSNSLSLNDKSASLISGFYRAETTTNSSFYTNGALSENYLGAGKVPTGTSTSLEIGGRTLGGLTERVFQGEIAEVIQISSDVSGLQQQSIVESYLASKYGISLDQTLPTDYVDSAGAVVWRASENVGYSADIFALSRDDLYNLDQRVSKSVNAGSILTIALDAYFTSPNQSAARTTAHSNDKQYLYFSNNGESTDSITTEVPSNEPVLGNNRIAREWRVTKSANFGQATHLSFSGFDNAYYLVRDADGDFSSGATVMGRLSATGEFPGVLLADGLYLTLVKGLDTDSDGVIDLMDSDDDNDGIPDSVEGNDDADNDGIPNSLDTDSDGDGLSDVSEGAGDTDNDGVPNYLDEDSDGDGVPDVTEGPDTYIVVDNAFVTGAEDSAIPLGINVDPAILAGGSQLDLLSTEIGFRDASSGSTPVTFTVPVDATYVRITGAGASDNSVLSGTQEENVFSSILVDIRNATYSGHTALVVSQRTSNTNYAFSDVPLGSSSDSGSVEGHSDAAGNSVTVSLTGNTLSVSETQALADQAFHVEYLTSSQSSSNYLGSTSLVLDTAATTDSITLPVNADFATLSVMMARTTSTDYLDEDKGFGSISIDTENLTASGVIYVHGGAGGENVSSYAFSNYDLTSNLPILSNAGQIAGDITANADSLSNMTLSLVGNVLTVTRTSDMANKYSAMFSANSYERLSIGSSARILGSSAVTGNYQANSSITNTFDLFIPGNAVTGTVSLVMYNSGSSNISDNENSGMASFSVDLGNETTSGSIMIMRSSTPDLVSWENVPFGTRLFDHADTVSNHASLGGFSDELAGILSFSRAAQADGSDVLRLSTNPSVTAAVHSQYQLVLGAQWSGQLPIEFATSVSNGTLSHGALNPDSGLWVVDPADIANLAFVPNEHFSGADIDFTINYSGENDTVSIDVTRVADAPIVSSVDQQGTQRVVADVSDSYSAALVDTDGSENLFVELTVTTGHTISDGVSSFTATAGNNSVDASSWDPSALTYLSDDVGVFTVGVRAVATDTDGFSATPDTAESNTSFDITVLLDTDGDGDADIIDTDDDNDGISDVDEGVADTDGDGTPDSLDTDSDGDGVLDATEGGGDADGDGILDHIDNDTDGDGIPDAAEGSIDSDGDSIPDYLDTDSDGDGLGDAAEGAIDSDNDGILDYLDTDSDGDGIDDAVEGSIDTDSDGILDYLDQDSDGDGINDSVEGAVDSDGDGAPDYVDLDADGDGITDSVEGVVDTDSDGQPDYLDTDSDGDGISDADEGTADSDGDGIPDAQDTDANNDGIPDEDLGTGDQDGDGVPDYLDDDIDGDGIANISEGAPNPTDDSDGDGIPNYADTDSDNDGIDDAAEGNGDLDGDGIPDYLDGDSDGDGIADINEGSVDSDNDGIPDYADSDSDGDGVPDSAEGSADTDLDGIPDYLDLDVDGDGIPDAAEGFVDSDGDGTADYKDLDSDNDGLGDGAEGTVDSDGDGIADYLDPDSDNDGLLDSEEAAGDTDGDGIADYLDDDSDNDGIPDGVEGNFDSDGDGAPDYLDDDSDGDGIPDILEGAGDADGDLIPDYLDSDSDNDGIPDSIEGAGDFDNDGIPDSIDTDANGDGIPDAALGSGDQDGDGVPDYLDGDIDGDGIANGTEGSVVPAEDSDGDGIPNYADTDSDNDGIADVLEGTGDADGDGIPDAHDTDSDNDGLADSAEGILDSDQDGILDYLDTDSDGDGINDSIETSADTDGDGIPNYLDTDSDNDGIPDAMESSGDADGDGAPDFLDNDSDGDGITDGAEGSNDTDGDGIPDYLDSDSDGDGIPDVIEGSTDSDGDGIPDAQDTDANGDGIPDANLSDGDIDNDGIPDYLDGDIDGDGIPNGSEGALNPAADSDGDGIPNYADSDSDNDGVPDSEEGTGDADGDGLLDAYDPDADNDGIPDGLEGTNDTDGDGVPDYLDSDSDNDGIPDSIEGSVDSDGDGIPDSQDSDGNNDGIPDSLLGSGDLDGDGIPDYLDSDIDGDGVSNTEEAQPDATTDSDGDGLPDFIDSDSDNDGVPDSEESRGDTDGDGIPDFADTDADGDGVPDVAEGFGDTDGDGVADFIDLDADNDGIPDVTEGTEDTDRDGVLDTKDLDSDNDGLPDLIEAGGDDVDGNGRVDNYVDNNNDGYDDGMAAVPLPVDNSDSDDLPDYKDLDSDNDGIPDTRESALAVLDSNGDGRIDDGVDAAAPPQSSDFPGSSLLNDILDEDGDGWADNIPANMIVDTDGDGTPNHQDRDSDGDGINDLIEAGGVDEDGDGEVDGWNDVDADGIPDDIDADQLGTSDIDGDGIADFADADYLNEADADGDGIVDRFDIDPFDEGFARSSTGEPLLSSALPDTDGDGISDVQQPINEQGFIRTGLGGGGSLNPLSLLSLWFFAAVAFRCRKATEFNLFNSVRRKTMHSSARHSIVAVAVLFSVSGCSTLGLQGQSEHPSLGAAVPEQHRVGNHVYVAAGVGTSRLKPDTSEVTTFAVNDRNNGGQQLTLGVDVSRQLSLELHSADLGAAGLSPEGGINYNMHGASALIYAGKNRHNYKRAGFTGYGRVGYGVMENSAAGNIPYRQEESNHLLVGAGLEYMTTVGLGFRGDLVSYEDDAQYAQLAIVYRMGSPRREQNGVIAESDTDATVKNPSEPLLQAAIAVSNEVNACEVQASNDNKLYFKTNSVVMSVEGRQLLQAVAQKMRSCDNLTLALSAHTDGTGTPGYNQNLSKQRASVVGQHLLAMGVQATRIQAKAYGETRPVAPNSTQEGRQLNRRVQMRLK